MILATRIQSLCMILGQIPLYHPLYTPRASPHSLPGTTGFLGNKRNFCVTRGQKKEAILHDEGRSHRAHKSPSAKLFFAGSENYQNDHQK